MQVCVRAELRASGVSFSACQSDEADASNKMASTILFLFVLLLRASLSVEQDLRTVNKSDSTFDSSVNRNKREVVVSNYSCAEGMMWLSYRCVENEL